MREISIFALLTIRRSWCYNERTYSVFTIWRENHIQISNISRARSQTLNVFRLGLQLSLPNPLKPGVKSRMKMYLEQHRQAIGGNKIVDHSDVVGASPVGAAPTASSFSAEHLGSMVNYTISLSSLCRLIWRHWTNKCLSGICCRVCV